MTAAPSLALYSPVVINMSSEGALPMASWRSSKTESSVPFSVLVFGTYIDGTVCCVVVVVVVVVVV